MTSATQTQATETTTDALLRAIEAVKAARAAVAAGPRLRLGVHSGERDRLLATIDGAEAALAGAVRADDAASAADLTGEQMSDLADQ